MILLLLIHWGMPLIYWDTFAILDVFLNFPLNFWLLGNSVGIFNFFVVVAKLHVV